MNVGDEKASNGGHQQKQRTHFHFVCESWNNPLGGRSILQFTLVVMAIVIDADSFLNKKNLSEYSKNWHTDLNPKSLQNSNWLKRSSS